mgnify:CR=1 FL=1
MNVNPKIFKAYDIRGIYPEELDEHTGYQVGRAFATFLDPREVIVGRDMRLSGPALAEALIEGLLEQGADVLDIGMVSTDQYYFACATRSLPGLMVTASHNPKIYNGFKMVRKMPYLLSGDEGIQDIRRLVEIGKFPLPGRKGRLQQADVQGEFVDKVLSLVDTGAIRPLKVVADTANGMVGPILTEIYRRLPVDLIGLYLEPDGNLPNHGLDPLQPENRRELQQRVTAEGADIGFAFDGDGDRFFAIDERGRFIPGDFLTAILASYLLETNPGSKILYDVRASWAVPERIKQSGGIPLMERVGHAFIKKRMALEGALFAGEVTGHYYFRDFFSADSGILPSLLLLELLSKNMSPISTLLATLESKYFLSGEINIRADYPHRRIEALAERYREAEQHRMDGLSVIFPDWHFNVRPSNTELLLRLNLESVRSLKDMETKRDEVFAVLSASNP